MDIGRVLSELKRERKQLDQAIAALEMIRKQSAKESRTAGQPKRRIKSGRGRPKMTSAIDRSLAKTANLIRFPRMRRSGS